MAPRERRRHCHRPAWWLTDTDVLAALARAWAVATITMVLFCSALALAPMWDGAIFLQGLHEALSTNPELPQPADGVQVDALAAP